MSSVEQSKLLVKKKLVTVCIRGFGHCYMLPMGNTIRMEGSEQMGIEFILVVTNYYPQLWMVIVNRAFVDKPVVAVHIR